MNIIYTPAEYRAAMNWFNSLSSAEMLAVRKHIPQRSVPAITLYWLAYIDKTTVRQA